MTKNTKADLILLFTLLVVAGALLLVPRWIHSEDAVTAEIIQDGTVIQTIDLSAVKDSYTIPLDSDPAAVLQVEPGCIYYLEADCPDQVCVRTGKLTRPGDTAACVPAGTVVRLTGASDTDTPDVLTY